MKSILSKLKGGDLRSIGRSAEVVKDVLENPTLFGDLFAGLLHSDRVIRMRAADAIEKITREHPEWLQSWKQVLLQRVALFEYKEVRWHIAQLLPRLKLRPTEREAAVRILMGYLEDKSSIVKTFSMQALVDLATQDERLTEEVKAIIERLTRTGTPAMKSRGRRLLKQFDSE